jgi:hypothetical protein
MADERTHKIAYLIEGKPVRFRRIDSRHYRGIEHVRVQMHPVPVDALSRQSLDAIVRNSCRTAFAHALMRYIHDAVGSEVMLAIDWRVVVVASSDEHNVVAEYQRPSAVKIVERAGAASRGEREAHAGDGPSARLERRSEIGMRIDIGESDTPARRNAEQAAQDDAAVTA